MSWRRYVFLQRIHPHSILIGFSLPHRKKGGNRGERRDESWRRGGGRKCASLGFHLHLASYAISSPRPSQHTDTLVPAPAPPPARIVCRCNVCIEPYRTMVQLTFLLCWIRPLHRDKIMLLNLPCLPETVKRSFSSGRTDWGSEMGWRMRAEREGRCVCGCVCEHKYGSERACVRVLYVDSWCTGLEGKRSRLLSLRTCQSSAERNQKESKSQHWAGVYVSVRMFVCV